jgi:hypothetical protein
MVLRLFYVPFFDKRIAHSGSESTGLRVETDATCKVVGIRAGCCSLH